MSDHKNRKTSLIRSAYYTIFLLCCHLTYYEGEMEAQMASLLVSVVGIALALTLCTWVELIFGLPLIGRWLAIPLGSIGLVNYFLFVRKHRGSSFGDEFSDYSERKQTLLYIVAVVAVIAILVGAGFSAVEYRHAHGFSA